MQENAAQRKKYAVVFFCTLGSIKRGASRYRKDKYVRMKFCTLEIKEGWVHTTSAFASDQKSSFVHLKSNSCIERKMCYPSPLGLASMKSHRNFEMLPPKEDVTLDFVVSLAATLHFRHIGGKLKCV